MISLIPGVWSGLNAAMSTPFFNSDSLNYAYDMAADGNIDRSEVEDYRENHSPILIDRIGSDNSSSSDYTSLDSYQDAKNNEQFWKTLSNEYLAGLPVSQGMDSNLNRIYNSAEAEKARKFSADEARKSRLWSEDMSSTAYQRSVADLKAAGLNPILAATNGGATSFSGASASTVQASNNSVGGDTLGDFIAILGNLTSFLKMFTKSSASKK